MSLSRKLTAFAQNPYAWAVVGGLITGLVLSTYLSGRIKIGMTGDILRHFENRIGSRTIRSTKGEPLVDARRLAGLSLWGGEKIGAVGLPKMSKSTDVTLPGASEGSLLLKGIVRYPDGSFEGVFRDQLGKRALFVKKGDSIKGLKILDIQPDRVIVLHNGREEAFTLFEEREKRHPSGRDELSRTTSSSGVQSGHVVLAKQEVQTALGDMASFLRQVRIIPFMDKGKPKGFKLLEIVPGSIVDRVGLKNGDVIERVNGRSIHTPQDAMHFFSMLQSGKGVTLKVKRKDRYKSIVIDLK